jgi:hypothetical protein
MCGVKTNVITAVEIRGRDASDTVLFPDLVKATARNFAMREVSADKVYTTVGNVEVVADHGAVPYLPFKSIHNGAAGGLFGRMYHYFNYNREQFLAHYHKRSNAESTFSMMKAKFGDAVRSKTDTAMANEVYAKILCHNRVLPDFRHVRTRDHSCILGGRRRLGPDRTGPRPRRHR